MLYHYRVVFQDETGYTLYRCRVTTTGDQYRAVNFACNRRPQWYEKCAQVAAFPLPTTTSNVDPEAPH